MNCSSQLAYAWLSPLRASVGGLRDELGRLDTMRAPSTSGEIFISLSA